jgi:hypothetical protein
MGGTVVNEERKRCNGKQIQDIILYGEENNTDYIYRNFGGMADISADTENKSLPI